MSLAWAHACLHMGINGRRDFDKGFEEKEAADPSLGCGQLSGQSCWAEFNVYVFHCFSFRIAKRPGQFWVQEMALFWGRVTWFSIAGFCFGGSKLRPDSFASGWIGVPSRRSSKVMSCYG